MDYEIGCPSKLRQLVSKIISQREVTSQLLVIESNPMDQIATQWKLYVVED